MSLLKRGKVWWSYIYVDGFRHQSSTGTSNKRQAEAIEQKFKEEVNNRRFQVVQYDHTITVAALAARFISDGRAKKHHIWHLKALLPFFGDTEVVRLNRNMAREFRVWRKGQKTLTDATINRALSVLRHILFWAVDEQLIVLVNRTSTDSNPVCRARFLCHRRCKNPHRAG